MKKTGRRLTLTRNSIKVLEAAHVRRAFGGFEPPPGDPGEDPISSEVKTALPTYQQLCPPTFDKSQRRTECSCGPACAY